METTVTRNIVSTEFTVDQLREGWKTGRDKVYQTFPHKVDENGVASVMLIDNSDARHEGDMPAQYVVTRETCTCGRLFCSHRAYAIAMNDKLHVPITRFKTMAGGGINVVAK